MAHKHQAGFTLMETMVSLAVLLAVSAIVMTGMNQMMITQGTVANRTEMHTSVRGVTELLQQEVGQAGRVSLSAPNANVTLTAAVAAGAGQAVSLTSSTLPAPFVYPTEVLTVDVGANQETVTLTGTSLAPTATFAFAHPAGAAVAVLGAFSTGVVPPAGAPSNFPSGSTGTVLKLYGDINGDGNMVYIEYTCNQGLPTAPGTLFRNQMPITAGAKPANDSTMILLSNVLQNPNDVNGNAAPCFNYQVRTLGANFCVTDVQITLPVQTQNRDPQTGQFQQETKALLNVSPRNVFEVFDTSNLVDRTRDQPMPATVANLLP